VSSFLAAFVPFLVSFFFLFFRSHLSRMTARLNAMTGIDEQTAGTFVILDQ
jgi:hypothetical protein